MAKGIIQVDFMFRLSFPHFVSPVAVLFILQEGASEKSLKSEVLS